MTGERRALGSRYELVDRLGEGAMGEVWRTWDRTGERWVAAKLLRRELASDQQIVGRFVQERSILMSLRHDAIVRVHDLVVEGEALAIVMDLVEGTDLRRHLREVGTLAPRDAVETTCAVLDALAAAHEQSCLHRDIKPDNVLLRGTGSTSYADRVLLTDFGIARLAQERTVQATGLLGTPGYMPPELFVHGRFSAASDVYATGVLLYELLGGRTPFSGAGTAHTVGFRHASVQPPRLPVPAALWQVLETMLAKDPTTRLSAAGTASALRELPAEVLDAPALPVQPAPDDWDLVQGTVVRSGPVQVELDNAQVDVGRTFLHAGEDTSSAPGRHAPVADRPSRRRLLAAAGVAGLALLAVVAGVVVATGSEPEDDVEVGSPAQSSLTDPPLPTGLLVERSADYDPAEEVLTLSLRYSARDAPLGGPFLEVLPGQGGECPSPSWTGATVTANVPQVSGIAVACGFAVDPGQVPADGEVRVEARFEMDLGTDAGVALDAWLTESADTAGSALQAQRDGDGYPVQRLQDIVVDVPAVVRKRSSTPTQVVVRLLPDWGNGPDRLRPLFDSSASGRPTSVLSAVAGGFDGVRLQGCDALAVSADGLRVVARYPDPDCTVTAQVGDFTRLEPASLAILGAGG
ncbi:Serine/threonine-protein kinase PrkC [Nocardioides dokdonensis FR1436]|uniref:non-specific serine/threonine protein kinase n=1 Tax=Nocardioides dokdonensis FR1436 TaxID=1300347 RepID=A0A1A9GGR9_9ACTN|nr:serine/threonine-protein kinase [Nocardioides dokdonensis]ANH36813.1 Serine/threonine-protein kinase PrkC [Nocardioides dokdonensis FR1436]